MAIDYSKLSLAIVTWNRPGNLRKCLASWIDTLPKYRATYVVNNGEEIEGWSEVSGRWSVIATGRPPEHVGNLAQSWNLAMLWAFRDSDVEWLLCSQDDMEAKSGWTDIIDGTSARDLYLAPAGDRAFLLHRSVLREVGWFDERYTTIGYQEWDWQMRALRALGKDRLSIEDAHGWYINPIDLGEYWTCQLPEGGPKSQQYVERNRLWMEQKWNGADLKGLLACGKAIDPMYAEVEWYPWFLR